MDWAKILKSANLLESPGRDEAIAKALIAIQKRYEKNGHKRAKGSNAAKVKKAPRMDYSKQ